MLNLKDIFLSLRWYFGQKLLGYFAVRPPEDDPSGVCVFTPPYLLFHFPTLWSPVSYFLLISCPLYTCPFVSVSKSLQCVWCLLMCSDTFPIPVDVRFILGLHLKFLWVKLTWKLNWVYSVIWCLPLCNNFELWGVFQKRCLGTVT